MLTTSGMPPTSLATTAAPQAIASRLTMPSGSYTDGQTNTVEADEHLLDLGQRQHPVEPEHARPLSPAVRRWPSAVSAAISGVSGAPAQQHQLHARVEMVGRRDQVRRRPSAG